MLSLIAESSNVYMSYLLRSRTIWHSGRTSLLSSRATVRLTCESDVITRLGHHIEYPQIKSRVGVIGASGEMGSRMTRLFVAQSHEVYGYVRRKEQLEYVAILGATPTLNLQDLVDNVESVIIAVKPRDMGDLFAELTALSIRKEMLLVPIAAGISLSRYHEWLGHLNLPVIRAMPNILMDETSGLIGLCAEDRTIENYGGRIEALLHPLNVEWCKEEEMDSFMVATACSPAICAYLIRSMANSYMKLGVPEDRAVKYTVSAMGATLTRINRLDDCTDMIKEVSSPGGATEQSIKVLDHHEIDEVISDAARIAYERCSNITGPD